MAVSLAGVLGDPVSHSKSPLIHNHWLKTYGKSGLYAPIEVAPGDLAAFLELAPRLGFVGFNVTIPHKEAVRALVSDETARARRAGSVNTLWLGPDGGWRGDSTDGEGFLSNLSSHRKGWTAQGLTVALVGAGGAARAVAAALIDAGAVEVRLANRTQDRAEAVAEALGAPLSVAPWPIDEAFFAGADLLINGTSLGMAGAEAWRWRFPALSSEVVATDMVYAPLETPFLRAAKAAGAVTVDGLGMLLHQAAPGFERWFGARPVVTTELRDLVLDGAGALP